MLKKIPSKDLHFKLQDWINKTLGSPNPIFNNLPACPYAKQAWVSGKVEVRQFQSWVDAYTDLLVKDFDFEKYEVVIFAFPHQTIVPKQLTEIIHNLQQMWNKKDIVVLEDHPDDIEEVKNFKLNFGECCLLLVQSRSKLNEARAYLESKGYYKNWDAEYKKDVQSR